MLGSHADAEEVVIDTAMIAWRKAEELRDPAALRMWLLRIATRQALSRRRRIGTIYPLLPEEASRLAGESGPSIDRIALFGALAMLPERMRAAVVLHYYADLTVPDVAVVLERSPNTIKSELREGLKRLRAELAERPDPRSTDDERADA